MTQPQQLQLNLIVTPASPVDLGDPNNRSSFHDEFPDLLVFDQKLQKLAAKQQWTEAVKLLAAMPVYPVNNCPCDLGPLYIMTAERLLHWNHGAYNAQVRYTINQHRARRGMFNAARKELSEARTVVAKTFGGMLLDFLRARPTTWDWFSHL